MNLLTKFLTSRKGKIAILLTLTLLYAAGIVCLFINLHLGVLLWAMATLPSLLIFLHQKRMERIEQLQKAEEEYIKKQTEDETT